MSSNDIFGPPENTRLVTIAAHVDSGKTTLADNLIEHNGIISERAAGTLRYLDSDPEEQRRGITMRSSAIGLRYQYTAKPNSEPTRMIVHLVDSPGHMDFCREVASSMGIADAGLLVLDAVEGMTARFQQVLRETERHSLVPILVLNKLDRLQSELYLTPTEAYVRLRSLLETVNAATAAMVASVMEHRNEESERRQRLEDIWTFEPAKGNVFFACAYYGWGFTVPMLSRTLFRNRTIPVKPLVLRQYLFGNYKRKGEKEDIKIVVWKQSSNDVPLFAEYALQPIWDICEAIQKAAVSGNGFDGVGDARRNRLPPDVDMKAIISKHGTSSEAVLRATLRRYCNLADATLHAVCEYAPSPKERALAGIPCEAKGPTKAYVSKLLFTDASNIQDSSLGKRQQGDLVLLGLARVLSGRMKTGQEYYCCDGSRRMVCARAYILMGSSFVKVDSVPAGHLCAIAGLEGVHSKTLTLADNPDSPPIQGVEQYVRPLVKVHIEPEETADAEYLERGLEKLRLADASVEVSATDKGERLLACLGELHLDQSIVDLEKLYCGKEGIKLKISDPIVEFAETTEWFESEFHYESFYNSRAPALRQTTIPPYKDEEGISLARHGRFRAVLPSQAAAINLRVVPLSDCIFNAIISDDKSSGELSEDLTSGLLKLGQALHCKEGLPAHEILSNLRDNVCSTDKNGNILVQYSGLRTGSLVTGVACGTVYVPNEKKKEDTDDNANTSSGDSIKEVPGLVEYEELQSKIRSLGILMHDEVEVEKDSHKEATTVWKNSLSGSLAAGFGSALRSGPMCEEPIRRTLVVLEGVEIALEMTETGNYRCPRQLVGGMVVSALRTGIRCALLSRPMRLMEAYLRLTLHSSLTGLGPLYQVLGKRRGKVIEDSMVDGTDLLMITAIVPQAEAFGLTPELMVKTSGEVTVPEMLFSHWETLNVDPFWVPTSEEEREDFGELQKAGDSSTGIDNTALFYIRNVRKRKGLTVDSARTITNAEKQKTLKNK